MSVMQMCQYLGISRPSFYRYWQQSGPAEADTAVRERLQRLALDHPHCGYRRLTAYLRREGEVVNGKRVLRLMREDNLLCLRRKQHVFTTDSGHDRPVYPNLARALRLSDMNQLWVADITYIRLREEFAYLAVVLDAYSRRVIGWALQPDMGTGLVLGALQQALRDRPVPPGLVHHSDRGVQYCSGAYVSLLHQYGIDISMSRRGCPSDNAKAESFMKTLKTEQVEGQVYATIAEARIDIAGFLDCTYNRERLHSALHYQSPLQFERSRNLACNPFAKNRA